jgi:TolB-like protein
MRLLKEIKERRLIPFSAAYLVTGFVALEAMDQLISYGFVPAIAYPVTLVLYLFGILSSFIVAWFHGAPGRQYAPRIEVVLQTALGIVAVVTGVFVYRTQATSMDVAGEMGPSATSVAVLYFEDLSTDGDLAYVADGLTEALIDQLSDVRSLDVVSRNGVLPYRNGGLRSDSIARALGVGTLIEGSVDQRGDELRIVTRLVDGFSGADIERAALVIPAGEFLVARDSVAGSVSGLLRQRLGEDVRLRELRAGTDSDEAWALAQRAERFRTDAEDNFDGGGETSISVEAYRQADSLLAMAEQVDARWTRPPGARAQAGYRRAWFALADGDLETSSTQIDLGLEYANRALTLDPGDADALEQRGTLKVLGFQLGLVSSGADQSALDALLSEAQADLEAAIREDPSLATAHAMLSFLFQGNGDNVGAVLSGRRALEEDAYLRGADRIYDRLYFAQYQLGQLGDSQYWCDEGRRRFLDNYRFTECQLWLLATPSAPADVDSAWTLLAELDSIVPEAIRANRHGAGMIMVAGVLLKADLADSASSVLAQVDHSEDIDPQQNLLYFEAGIRASTGDLDGSLAVLRRFLAATPGSTIAESNAVHWWWGDLRGRPEFEQLVDRSN